MSAEDFSDVFDADVTHVWWGTVEGTLGPDAAAVLSAAERDAARAMTAEAGRHYAGAHVAVRRILAAYLGTGPAELRLGRLRCPECGDATHGAPCVEWPQTELSYSLSRSGPHWLLGVTGGGRRIGVDLEQVLGFDTESVAPLVLSDRELAHLGRESESAARLAVFLRYWTRKEAVLKASGIGLVADAREVEVHGPPDGGPLIVRHSAAAGPDTWLVEDLAVGPGRYAAIAREAAAAGPLRLIEKPPPAAAESAGPPPSDTNRSAPWPSATLSLSMT
ncbi:4'-phosphopantetheinyl transferase superfamily protein [Streptomyces sp. NRRL S-87]|uniref:4'-phosphopantetheinyl transferase family protein n=1 Tax=Streptomyces sp. NRRL S-87 TaxID=1463920 RepID=UPI00068C0602|nr:4'-phosphopantetheinyl transferase superfamily protein [Streptomyces sp. NRRL S-87]